MERPLHTFVISLNLIFHSVLVVLRIKGSKLSPKFKGSQQAAGPFLTGSPSSGIGPLLRSDYLTVEAFKLKLNTHVSTQFQLVPHSLINSGLYPYNYPLSRSVLFPFLGPFAVMGPLSLHWLPVLHSRGLFYQPCKSTILCLIKPCYANLYAMN